MVRPRLPDNQLKNPRRIRKSTVHSKQLDVPEPSKAMKKAWKPFVELAMVCLMENDRRDNIAKKTRMYISFPTGTFPPEGFPIGKIEKQDKSGTLRSYNAEQILLWAWERKLADMSPTMFYAKLRKYNMEIRNMLDIDKFLDYNVN